MPEPTFVSARKILAGPRLKRLRRDLGLTQARMAEELTVSPSYLNLMERNQRPITVPVLARLTDVYGIDPREFMEDGAEAAVEGLEQLLADPLFRDAPVARVELHDAAEYAPSLIAAMQKLYRAYAAARETGEARVLANADPDRTESTGGGDPIERVRAILQENRNHFPEIDALAERFASDLALEGPEPFHVMSERLRGRHGIRVRLLPVDVMGERLRWYDLHRRQLLVSEIMDQPGRTFQVAYQLAISEHGALVNAICARLEPRDDVARRLLRITLANYFAGAVMMPYARFHEAAEATGYDLEVLAARFGASFEQVAHRLTTMGRPTARGIPFFLVRVDIAGNVSKRFSAGRFRVLAGGRYVRPVERACHLRGAGAHPHAGDRVAGRRPVVLDGADRPAGDQSPWNGRTPLRPRARLRDQIRPPPRLCATARSGDTGRDADRHQLPPVRSPELPPAGRPAGAAPFGYRRHDA